MTTADFPAYVAARWMPGDDLQALLEQADESRQDRFCKTDTAPDDALMAVLEAEMERREAQTQDDRKVYEQARAERLGKRLTVTPSRTLHDADEQAIRARYVAQGGIMSARDMLALPHVAPVELIPGILPAGTTVLAAPPKIGKSWMCLQMAAAIAGGGTFLDEQCVKGSALYLPMEEGEPLVHARLLQLDLSAEVQDNMFIGQEYLKLGSGLEGYIERHLERDDLALIILDTLGRARIADNGKRNAYQVDVDDVGRLQELIRDRPTVGLLLVHHTKKAAEDDFVAQVSGTHGIAGSADSILLLKRKRHEDVGTLELTSKIVREKELTVRFVDGQWTKADDAVAGSRKQSEVLSDISLNEPTWPKSTAARIQSERTAVQHHYTSLLEEGRIVKTAKGYVVRSEQSHSASTNTSDE